MGSAYEVRCSQCRHEWYLSSGRAMREYIYTHQYMFDMNPITMLESKNKNDNELWERGSFGNTSNLYERVTNHGIVDKAFRLIKDGGLPTYNYGEEMDLCPVCNELYTNYYFEIVKDGEAYVSDYTCSKCNNALIHIEIKVDKNGWYIAVDGNRIDWHCPYCGNNEILTDGEILFD